MPHGPEINLKSTFPDIAWPAIPADAPSTVLALRFQLDQAQWWSAERLTGLLSLVQSWRK